MFCHYQQRTMFSNVRLSRRILLTHRFSLMSTFITVFIFSNGRLSNNEHQLWNSREKERGHFSLWYHMSFPEVIRNFCLMRFVMVGEARSTKEVLHCYVLFPLRQKWSIISSEEYRSKHDEHLWSFYLIVSNLHSILRRSEGKGTWLEIVQKKQAERLHYSLVSQLNTSKKRTRPDEPHSPVDSVHESEAS